MTFSIKNRETQKRGQIVFPGTVSLEIEIKPVCLSQVQQKEEPDESIAHAVSVKLGEAAGISYSEIAARAYECGRTELAIKVLHTHQQA